MKLSLLPRLQNLYLRISFQLTGVGSESIQLKACLSHGKRLVPTLSAHFDPYSDFPLSGTGLGGSSGSILSGGKGLGDGLVGAGNFDKEEAALCPGGRLLSLNVTANERIPNIRRVIVPYPAAGEWFLTLLPTCSKINIRKGNGET